MKIACIQPLVYQDRKKCYSEIETLFKDLLEKFDKCELVVLPERWVPFLKDLPQNLQEERGSDYAFVKKLATTYNINIISGTIWEKRDNSEKPFITSYFFNEQGEEIGRQDKIHLYSYERDQFIAGKELNLFKLKDFYFAILICFDMAFFETPRLAALNGADLLLSPTQIREEGMVNWGIYLKARALENRIPVVASNTYGSFLNRQYLGNSKIISFVKGFFSPSKLKVTEGPINSNGFVYDDIDLKFPRKLRKLRLNERIGISSIRLNKINK